MNKNIAQLKSFTAYCEKYPSMRFWQALLSWSGYPYIVISPLPPTDIDPRLKDTFFIE
jgi:hypothetical protein